MTAAYPQITWEATLAPFHTSKHLLADSYGQEGLGEGHDGDDHVRNKIALSQKAQRCQQTGKATRRKQTGWEGGDQALGMSIPNYSDSIAHHPASA